MRGKVKRKVTDRGFGFIENDKGKEYFFHHSQCKTPFDSINEGDKVKFEIESSPKGPRANGVEVFEEEDE